MNNLGYIFSGFPLAGIFIFDCSPLWLAVGSVAAAAIHGYCSIKVAKINKN